MSKFADVAGEAWKQIVDALQDFGSTVKNGMRVEGVSNGCRHLACGCK